MAPMRQRTGGVGRIAAGALTAAVLLLSPAAAWAAAGEAVLETLKVHSPALAGNLEGNSPLRDVIVVLPPSYGTDTQRRYPVVYFLHGYFASSRQLDGLVKYQALVTAAAARGHEFILVAPDSYTRFAGAMYSNSITTGDFEGFVSRDLVAWVDGRYRTLARPAGRGLAGHSMGGYGALKIAMKYPGIFSSVYALSPCCLSPRTTTPEQAQRLAAMPIEDAMKAPFAQRAAFAQAVAWSPNPRNPPYYADFGVKGGKLDPVTLGAWAANAPLAMLPQYVGALKGLTAIGLEVGDKDALLRDDTAMHEALGKFGIPHDWAVYDGDHGNRLAERMRDYMLPFFARHLAKR